MSSRGSSGAGGDREERGHEDGGQEHGANEAAGGTTRNFNNKKTLIQLE